MLPVLLRLTIPAGLGLPAAAAAAALLLLGRAVAFRRRLAREGRGISLGRALLDDKVTAGVLAALVFLLWRGGVLDGEISLPLHTYGLLIASAFVVGIWLAQREGRRQGQDPERIADLSFWILVAALVGSRIFFILVNWGDYFGEGAWVTTRLGRIPRLLAVWEGGLVFYGGFVAAALTAFWYLRRHGMAFLPFADTLIPSVAFGHFMGRLGCFAAGCCWGEACDARFPLGARFPPDSLAYQSFLARPDADRWLAPDRGATVALHPTQLYESAGELLLFALLVLAVRPNKRFQGQALAAWLLGYAVLRTAVEAFRGDVERGVYAGLGVGQWTSMAIFAAGLAVWAVGRRRARAARAAVPALA
ncbi:MAG TPA: prolipoprotein diacylglyceryl transferase [Anaeromyxobacteraceae bacterium]|jgi:phosphatidylglycerol:prolipoprotein diacylglycerol transferase